MVPPVEAQSLSSLTSLFANPPQYPRNPTHEVREPLVLYIIRVPASRDVFLTPLKPPTKATISVEAIQSCLYYCHVNTPEDDSVKQSLEEQKRSEETDRLANLEPIHRKALPSAPFANYPPTERPPIPPKSYPHFQPKSDDPSNDAQGKRFAERGVHLRLQNSSEGRRTSVRRKPIGPRPLDPVLSEEPTTISRTPVGNVQDELLHSSSGDQTLSILNGIESLEDSERPALPPRRVPPADYGQSTKQQTERVVLIRRDLSSGSQWNVGTISLSSGSAMVEINTPGYQRFVREGPECLKNIGLGEKAASPRRDKNSEEAQLSTRPSSNLPATKFFWRTINTAALSGQTQGRIAHRQSKSEDIFNSVKQTLANPPQDTNRLKTIFTSPWEGICSFSTGLDGRSLKCRHSLPANSSTGETSSETVAEVRFNLPWLRVKQQRNARTQSEGDDRGRNGPTTKQLGAENRHILRRSMQRFKQGSWSSKLSATSQSEGWSPFHNQNGVTEDVQTSPASDGEGRMDLRLGQEKAGGGFKGKSAKLGKLIIEDEGLKMGDLLVAALMSVWWQHYEKSVGEIGS